MSCLFRSLKDVGYSTSCKREPNMKLKLFTLTLLCISCGASALATRVPAALASSPVASFLSLGTVQGNGTDTTSVSKSRRKRYISMNDRVAILDYHNKVRGRVFPPASNMEYMVSFTFRQTIWNRCHSSPKLLS